MSTKVKKLNQLYNMHPHKAEAIVDLLDNHIPKRHYTSEIIRRCEEQDVIVTQQVVIDVKLFRSKNLSVLNVLLEFARENEKAQKKLEKMVTSK